MTQETTQNVLVVAPTDAVSRKILPLLAQRSVRGLLVRKPKAVLDRLESSAVRMAFVELPSAVEETVTLIARIRCQMPDLPILAIAAEGDISGAVQATRAGASDVLTSPIHSDTLAQLVEKHLPSHRVGQIEDAPSGHAHRIAGQSQSLRQTVELARRVARASVPVLITGQSGTGKELISYLIHWQSPRRKNPYIRVNCAAISESLLESELFGHERGAFTGAHARREGRFELAHNGTLLLDEISETGPRLQAELLRVLEEQDFERLGGSESIRVNVRVICTSNRDLTEEVRQGRFRQDLYYRIRGVQLHVPPLRDRLEDIPALIWHFVNLYAGEVGRKITAISDEMLRVCARYDWPGNVRQLRNLVRSALVLGEGPALSLDGAEHLLNEGADPAPSESHAQTLSLQDVERQAVLEALRQTNAHQAKAAQLLGISDRTLRDKIRRYREDGHLNAKGEELWSASRAS